MIEPLLVSDRVLARLAPSGLPDIRVIVDAGRPLMAMLRMPTIESGGRGNLHQGGIGAALDLRSGRVRHAVAAGRPIDAHPDTGARFDDTSLPFWDDILDMAAALWCGIRVGVPRCRSRHRPPNSDRSSSRSTRIPDSRSRTSVASRSTCGGPFCADAQGSAGESPKCTSPVAPRKRCERDDARRRRSRARRRPCRTRATWRDRHRARRRPRAGPTGIGSPPGEATRRCR